MRRTLVAITLGALMLAPTFTPFAAADEYHNYYGGHRGGDWVFGAGFRVGGFHFSIGFAEPRYGYQPVHYYRSSPRLAYRGHRCHDRCFRHERYAYHHRDCPLVRHHFGRYRVEPRHVFARYAPRYGYYDRDRRGYERYDRYDRYDRHDRYDRRHRRHDRDDDRWQDRRGRHRDRDHDHRDRHRGRRGHDHRDHRGGHCPYDR